MRTERTLENVGEAERQRLQALWDAGILDSEREERFDRITRLARKVFSVPIAAVTVVDLDRHWFKSCVGLEVDEIPYDQSFCAHALSSDEPLVIEDATVDRRLADNPLVTGEPHLVFYAGCPVRLADGTRIGTLCLLDYETRRFTDDDRAQLRDFAGLVETELGGAEPWLGLPGLEPVVSGDPYDSPLTRGDVGWRALPFLAIFAAALAIGYINSPVHIWALHAATALGAALILFGRLGPWRRWPTWSQAVVPLGFLVVAGFARHGAGGPLSGYSALGFLPVLWLTLYGSARQTVEGVVGFAAMLIVPIIVDVPEYPEYEWRRVLFSSAIALVIGLSGHQLLREMRRLTAGLDRQRRQLTEAEELFRGAFDNAPLSLAVINLDGRYMMVNDVTVAMSGISRGELLRTDRAMLPLEDVDGEDRFAELVKGERDSYTVKRRFERHDGPRWFDSTLALARDERGEPAFVVVMTVDVTEQDRIDRMKNEFISVVGHELRTPLTSLRGSLGLLNRGVAGELPEDAIGLLTVAETNTERLIRLVNDVLDLERIEAGRIELEPAPHRMDELLEATLGGVERPEAVDVDVGDERVHVDGDRLVQVLTNLVSNALKFSPSGERVTVTARPVGGYLRVEVRDLGRGVPTEMQSRIFDRFAQVDSSDARDKGGTGLGLAIARAIVVEHGGDMGVDSIVGQGSCFWFTVPRLRPVTTIPRILIVEDDAGLARILARFLAEDGLTTTVASNTTGAIRAVEEGAIDAVVLDLALPDGHGSRIIAELRDRGAASMPLVVYSATDVHGVDRLSLRLGPTEFLLKGRDAEHDLAAAVRRVVGITFPAAELGPTAPEVKLPEADG